MNFEDKKLKLSVFDIPDGLVIDTGKIRKNRACPIEDLPFSGFEDVGWASGKSELSIDLADDDIRYGEYLYLTMRCAERHIPGSLLKALVRKKTEEYLKVNDAGFVPSKILRQIKEEASEALRAYSVPEIKSIWVIITPNRIYSGASSQRECEMLRGLILQTFGIVLPYSTPRIEPQLTNEFLTYLFQLSEEPGAPFTLESPIDLIDPDKEKPCTRALACGEMAKNSSEVCAALQNDKLLSKAKLIVTGDAIPGYDTNDVWRFVLDDKFAISSLQLPECEELDFSARLPEKTAMIDGLISFLQRCVVDFINAYDREEYRAKRIEWINNRV